MIDECSSQAIHSDSEDGEEDGEDGEEITFVGPEHARSSDKVTGDIPPLQLVMPSISMPKRRPFTERGKKMGRVKMMTVGPAGTGKTCLIHSLMSTCDDIVHMDTTSNASISSLRRRHRSTSYVKTNQITEVLASTKAYPPWWSDVDDGRRLQRRRSIGGVVLDRNICFVDTPGWDNSGATENEDMQDAIDAVVEYIESTLIRNATMSDLGDSELLSNLSGGGGVQVDAVLYLLRPGCSVLSSSEAESIRRLSALTNVIPLIGFADMCTDEQIKDSKAVMRNAFNAAGIEIFDFNESSTGDAMLQTISKQGSAKHWPYAVSCTNGDDCMDASDLTASDYTLSSQPGDLSKLSQQLFEPDNIQRLRHYSAKKFLKWRRERHAMSLDIHKQELLALSMSQSHSFSLAESEYGFPDMGASSVYSIASGVLIPHASSGFYGSPGFDPQAHAGSQNTLDRFVGGKFPRPDSQVFIADWAQDLRRALNMERSRMTEMTSRNTQVVDNLSLVKAKKSTEDHESRRTRCGDGAISTADPLGLLAIGDDFSRRGRLVLQVLGGCGIVATMAVWIVRNWDMVTEFLGIHHETHIPGYALVGSASRGSGGMFADWDWKQSSLWTDKW